MHLKRARRWLRRHPVYSVFLAFFSFTLVSLPPYLADTWALVSDRPLLLYLEERLGILLPSFSLGWVTVPLGILGLLVIIGLLVTGRRDEIPQGEHEKIVKGLNDRISELSEKLEEETERCESVQSELSEFRDKYAWLHTIAQNQKTAINRYVRVQKCEIIGHDFLEELYVDFKFSILNVSVYTISIEDSVKGDIKLGSRLLSKGMKMSQNDAVYCRHNEVKHFIVRQWLDRDEIASILKATDDGCTFRLQGLDITVKIDDLPEMAVTARRLDMYGLKLSSRPLRELSQKLRIEVQQAYFRGYWILSAGRQTGTQINVQANIENPRAVDVYVRDFRLTITAGGQMHNHGAEEGEIYETHRMEESGEVKYTDPRLENLNAPPFLLGKGQRIDGRWLKFIIPDLFLEEEEIYSATLTIIDSAQEEHSTECSLKYE